MSAELIGTREVWLVDGITWSNVHVGDRNCVTYGCTLHNPTDHHMRTWEMLLMPSTLIVRMCEHNFSHPDPDSLRYFARIGDFSIGFHTCDGCCHVS